MKKSSIILIGIVYIASIVIISIFGMKSVVYNEVVPATRVECINTTKDNVTVTEPTETNPYKIITVKLNATGTTSLQLEWRVYPDNATNKTVTFTSSLNRPDLFEFVKDVNGNCTGEIIFKKATPPVTITIQSEDGTKPKTQIKIVARA